MTVRDSAHKYIQQLYRTNLIFYFNTIHQIQMESLFKRCQINAIEFFLSILKRLPFRPQRMSVQLFIRDIQFMSQVVELPKLSHFWHQNCDTFQYLGHYVLEWPRLPVLENKEKVGKVETAVKKSKFGICQCFLCRTSSILENQRRSWKSVSSRC